MPQQPASRSSEPTSLTQLARGSRSTCASCGADRVTEIGMTLTDGSRVTFVSCHACETKSWREGDGDLELTTVMDKARKIKA